MLLRTANTTIIVIEMLIDLLTGMVRMLLGTATTTITIMDMLMNLLSRILRTIIRTARTLTMGIKMLSDLFRGMSRFLLLQTIRDLTVRIDILINLLPMGVLTNTMIIIRMKINSLEVIET